MYLLLFVVAVPKLKSPPPPIHFLAHVIRQTLTIMKHATLWHNSCLLRCYYYCAYVWVYVWEFWFVCVCVMLLLYIYLSIVMLEHAKLAYKCPLIQK